MISQNKLFFDVKTLHQLQHQFIVVFDKQKNTHSIQYCLRIKHTGFFKEWILEEWALSDFTF